MLYALITGASKGLGKAIAQDLAGRGYNLILVARSGDLLKQLSAELMLQYRVDVKYLALDLSQTGAALSVFEWCKGQQLVINILVNNAGYGLGGALTRFSLAENRAMLQLNMITLAEFCQLFLPMLKNQQRLYILNIASTAAYQAVPLLGLYAASKSFVLQFSRGLRQELKGTAVSVTCISPGPIDTDFPQRAALGKRAIDAAKKLHMLPKQVAGIAVKAMFAGQAEVVTGFINKLGVWMAWLLPKGFVEKMAGSIYR